MKNSEAFEQQIHRIHELLEGFGAIVTWDDHIPDPDNPSQQRQIDITVRRDGKLTLIECRQHKSPQDVTWIEGLIGRRKSLAPNAMIIAVSSSGFTEGAQKKAKRHDIILRDLRELTDPEVKSWGQQVTLTLYFYQYSDLEVSLYFKRETVPMLDKDAAESEFTFYPGMQSLFNAAAQQLGSLNFISGEHAGRTVDFGFRLQLPGLHVTGEPVLEVGFQGKVRFISKEVILTAVRAYGEPDHNSMQREVAVETFALGETSIVHDESRISVLLDISQVEMPPFCQFLFFKLVGEKELDHEAVELVGIDKLWVYGRMNINICSM